MRILFFVSFFVAHLAFATSTATRPFVMATIDTSSDNITTGYDGANAEVLSDLANPTHILVWNETESNVGVSLSLDTCNAQSPDHLIAPGVTGTGAGVSADEIAIKKIVCLRSLSGSSITSGLIYVSTW